MKSKTYNALIAKTASPRMQFRHVLSAENYYAISAQNHVKNARCIIVQNVTTKWRSVKYVIGHRIQTSNKKKLKVSNTFEGSPDPSLFFARGDRMNSVLKIKLGYGAVEGIPQQTTITELFDILKHKFNEKCFNVIYTYAMEYCKSMTTFFNTINNPVPNMRPVLFMFDGSVNDIKKHVTRKCTEEEKLALDKEVAIMMNEFIRLHSNEVKLIDDNLLNVLLNQLYALDDLVQYTVQH